MTLEDAFLRLRRQLQTLPNNIGRSVAESVAAIGPEIRGFINPVNRLREAFSKAEQGQKRAIAMGTTLAKFQQENSVALSKLFGGQQELIQVLMEFRQSGLRKNNDELNKLAVRMRYSGQSTAGLTQLMGRLSVYTGDNTKVLSDFARQNNELSRTYKVTNESLIDAIASLDDTIKQQAALAGSTNAGKVAALLTAMAPAYKAEITRMMSQFMDPGTAGLRLKVLTGNLDIASKINRGSDREGARAFINAVRAVQRTGMSLAGGESDDPFTQLAQSKILERSIGLETYAASKNLANFDWDGIEAKLNSMEPEKSLTTAEQHLDASKTFYQKLVNDFYPSMVSNLETISKLALGYGIYGGVRSIRNMPFLRTARQTAAGTAAGYAPYQGSFLTGMLNRTAPAAVPAAGGLLAGTLGRGILARGLGLLGGPMGLAISIGLPYLIDYFMSDDREKDSEASRKTAEAVTEMNERQKTPLKLGGFEEFLAEQIRKATQGPIDRQPKTTELENRLNDLTKVIRGLNGRINNREVAR